MLLGDGQLFSHLVGRALRINVSIDKEDINLSKLKLEESVSKGKYANKLLENIKDYEFRPEIVIYLLNYLKYHTMGMIFAQVLFLRKDIGLLKNPLLLNILLECHDYKVEYFQMSMLNRNDKCNLLLVGHVEDVNLFTRFKINEFLPRNTKLEKVYVDILKMVTARLTLLPNDHDAKKKLDFYARFKLVDWQKECEKQVKSMKKIEIVDKFNVTFYDILTQPVHRVANYIKREDLLENLESSYMKFPAYAGFLEMSVEKGERRQKLIETCATCLLNLIKRNFQIQCPNVCIDKILHYFSVMDLLRLSSVHT